MDVRSQHHILLNARGLLSDLGGILREMVCHIIRTPTDYQHKDGYNTELRYALWYWSWRFLCPRCYHAFWGRPLLRILLAIDMGASANVVQLLPSSIPASSGLPPSPLLSGWSSLRWHGPRPFCRLSFGWSRATIMAPRQYRLIHHRAMPGSGCFHNIY